MLIYYVMFNIHVNRDRAKTRAKASEHILKGERDKANKILAGCAQITYARTTTFIRVSCEYCYYKTFECSTLLNLNWDTFYHFIF